MRPKISLYGRANCSHCEQLKFALDLLNNRQGNDHSIPYEYIDVDSSVELQSNYGLRVPVLICGTDIICEGVFDISTLEQDIAKALGTAS